MINSLILIDTSIWIEALSKNIDKNLKNTLETMLIEQRVATTSLIKLELLSGTLNKIEFDKLKEELNALLQLDFIPKVWDLACQLGFSLRKKGLKIPNTDLLLAATSLHYECRLWHKDKHFSLIAKHFPLKTYQIF